MTFGFKRSTYCVFEMNDDDEAAIPPKGRRKNNILHFCCFNHEPNNVIIMVKYGNLYVWWFNENPSLRRFCALAYDI